MPYLTPDEIPEDDACRPLSIPASAEWLAIVSGALTELTQTWNWEEFGSVTVDEAVARMQTMIDNYYADACNVCELPEGGSIVRLNQDYVVEELIDGEWQSPSETYTIPPPTERTDPTSEQRICLAAKNAENILHQAYEEITDSATLSLTVIEAIAVLGTFLIAAVAAPLGAVVVALAALGIASWKVGYDIVEFVTSDFWDTDFTENFTCALIRCATDVDGVVTFDFEAVNTELINQIEWLDPTISSYTLAGQVRWLIAQFGADGLNAAGATTEITNDDCSFCGEGWCYTWDFTVDDGGWTADTYGTYVPGEGWALASSPSAILIYRAFDDFDAVISQFIVETDNDGGPGVQLGFTNNPGFTAITITKSLASGNETTDILEGTPTSAIPGVGWNANADNGSIVYLRSVTIGHTEGTSPMGESNC